MRPDENIEAHVSRLYNRISSPVMTDVAVKFEYDELTTAEGNPGQPRVPQGELRPVRRRAARDGRPLPQGRADAKVTITGKVGGEEQKFDFPAKLASHSGDESYAFVEKLWAMRRIGEIIDELDLKGRTTS